LEKESILCFSISWKIIAIDLKAYNGKFICQKDAFLCAAKGVSVGIEFSKKSVELYLAGRFYHAKN